MSPSESDLSSVELKQKEYYNQIAKNYDEHYASPYAIRYRYRIFDAILAGMDLKGMNVLDALCGGGESTGYFLERGATVTGIDISEGQCEMYAKRFPQGKVICGSALAMPFTDATFDIVVTESLHHLHPQVKKGVAEIERVLKPGGHFIDWEPSGGSLLDLARRAWYAMDKTYFEDNEQSLDLKELVKDTKGRLDVVRTNYGGNLGYLLVHSSMVFRVPIAALPYYAPALLAIDRVIEKIQGRWNACWFLALFRKPLLLAPAGDALTQKI